MASLFDSPSFNQRLFFPRPEVSPAPRGALDLFVPGDGIVLHLRWHRPVALPLTVLFFHGNGEV